MSMGVDHACFEKVATVMCASAMMVVMFRWKRSAESATIRLLIGRGTPTFRGTIRSW